MKSSTNMRQSEDSRRPDHRRRRVRRPGLTLTLGVDLLIATPVPSALSSYLGLLLLTLFPSCLFISKRTACWTWVSIRTSSASASWSRHPPTLFFHRPHARRRSRASPSIPASIRCGSSFSLPGRTLATTGPIACSSLGRRARRQARDAPPMIKAADGLTNRHQLLNRKREVALLQPFGWFKQVLRRPRPWRLDQRPSRRRWTISAAASIILRVASDVAVWSPGQLALIPGVEPCFPFDVPHHPYDYVHRIGRRRACRSGSGGDHLCQSDQNGRRYRKSLSGKPIPCSGEPPASADAEERRPGRHGGRREGRVGRPRPTAPAPNAPDGHLRASAITTGRRAPVLQPLLRCQRRAPPHRVGACPPSSGIIPLSPSSRSSLPSASARSWRPGPLPRPVRGRRPTSPIFRPSFSAPRPQG